MAYVYLAEYKGVGVGVSAAAGPQAIQAPIVPANLNTRMPIGSTVELSTAFSNTTRLIEVHAEAGCHVLVTSGATTVSSTQGHMIAGDRRFFSVNPGQILAVITSTT